MYIYIYKYIHKFILIRYEDLHYVRVNNPFSIVGCLGTFGKASSALPKGREVSPHLLGACPVLPGKPCITRPVVWKSPNDQESNMHFVFGGMI